VTVREVDHKAVDILLKTDDEDNKKPPKPEHCGGGEFLFMIAQLITVLMIGLFCTYESTDEDG
jgi:hypothetical protein